MSFAKTKAALIALVTVWLCGCSSHTLASREIVRAVFFSEEDTVCLLLEGTQSSGEQNEQYKLITGQGETLAQALNAAETQLNGQAYYGLMDVAVFPATVSLEQARDLGELLYDKAQPAPEAAIVSASWSKNNASELYETIQAAQQPHCGLERLFEQTSCCLIPFWQEQAPGCLLLLEGESLRITRPEDAQLLFLLKGQTDRMEMTFANQTARMMADARISVEVRPDCTTVTVTLRDIKLDTLTPSVQEQTALQQLMESWQQAFDRYVLLDGDPFRLGFWAACRYGPGACAANPVLEVFLE